MILAYRNIPKAWKSANKFIKLFEKNYLSERISPKWREENRFLFNTVGALKNVKTIAVHIQAQDYPYMSKNRLKSRWTVP
jgi:hypothetical protein